MRDIAVFCMEGVYMAQSLRNLQRRSNGIWYIVYHHGGRQRKKSTGTEVRAEAIRRRDLFLQRLSSDDWGTVEKNPVLEEFEARYTVWAEQHLTRQTRETQFQRWGDFISWAKPKRLGDVRKATIQDFVTHLLERGLAKTTVNNYLRDISAFYGHAIKDLEIYSGKNPVVGVKRLRVEDSAPPFLTLDEIDRLLVEARAHSDNLHWFCGLGVYAGLRLGEIVGCRWEYFDWNAKLLNLPSAEGATLKSHRGRSVSLAEKLIAILKPHAQPPGYLFESRNGSGGKCKYRYNPKKAFKTVAARAGLPQVTPHWLRHTFCTQLGLAGVPVSVIQKEAGHSDIKVTQRYIHAEGYQPSINAF